MIPSTPPRHNGYSTEPTTLAMPPTPCAALGRWCCFGMVSNFRPTAASASDSRFSAVKPTRSLPAPGSTRPWVGLPTK
eukprot:7082388-Pyramimonas_sp.AAC.1